MSPKRLQTPWERAKPGPVLEGRKPTALPRALIHEIVNSPERWRTPTKWDYYRAVAEKYNISPYTVRTWCKRHTAGTLPPLEGNERPLLTQDPATQDS